MFRPLSVAAACNSKLKLRQKRLRSASPQALLMRPPNGAWMISCIPPPSSKKRSAMIVSCVGTSPSTARPAGCTRSPARRRSRPARIRPSARRRVSATCRIGSARSRPEKCARRRSLIFLRNSATWAESSWVRAGASPRQKGTLGGAPCASSTSTRPDLPSTRRMRHDVFPSSMMSPALLSTAKSSSSVPTTIPSGSATTVKSAVSGIAPPLVIAASRAAAPRPQLAVHLVMMNVGAITSAPRSDPLGQHLEDRIVGIAR